MTEWTWEHWSGYHDCAPYPADVAHHLAHAIGTHWRSPKYYLADPCHGPLAPGWWGRRGECRSVPPSRLQRVARMAIGDVARACLLTGKR